MAELPRYIGEHYPYIEGLEKKLYGRNETLRYRNFFDKPTKVNLSNRLDHFKQMLVDVNRAERTTSILQKPGLLSSKNNIQKQIVRIERLLVTSDGRLKKFCNDHNMPLDEGYTNGLNGFNEILVPNSQAIKDEQNFNIVTGLVTTTTVVVGAVLLSDDLSPDAIKLWVNLMDNLKSTKPPETPNH